MPKVAAPQKSKKFSYYRKLSAAQKRIYDKSDAITRVKLPAPERFHPAIIALQSGLEREDREMVADAASRIVGGLCIVFNVPKIKVKVLSKRPSGRWGELHGLYESGEGQGITLTVWMRTAERKDVVAFKTFLRTIVHEFMHHLDYHLIKLDDSFHTAGFYKRENSLAKGLMKGIE